MRLRSLNNQLKILASRSGFVRLSFISSATPRVIIYIFCLPLGGGLSSRFAGKLKTKTARLRFLLLIRVLDRLIKNGLFI